MNFWDYLYGLLFEGGYPNWNNRATWDMCHQFINFISELAVPVAAILLIVYLIRQLKKK